MKRPRVLIIPGMHAHVRAQATVAPIELHVHEPWMPSPTIPSLASFSATGHGNSARSSAVDDRQRLVVDKSRVRCR